MPRKKIIKKWTRLEEAQLEHWWVVERRQGKWIARKLGRKIASIRKKIEHMGLNRPRQLDRDQMYRIMDELEAMAERENLDVGHMLSRAYKFWHGRLHL